MRNIMKPIRTMLSSGQTGQTGSDGWVVRVASLEGFGGRRSGEVLLVGSEGLRAGGILGGSADAAIESALASSGSAPGTVLRVPIGDTEAVSAGLACGGTAEVLAQRVSSFPAAMWDAIDTRRPQLVATLLDGAVGATSVSTLDGIRVGTLGDPAADDLAFVSAHQSLVRKGGSSMIAETELGRVFVELISPAPQMVVLGDVALAHAIAAQGSMLGWTVSVYDERKDGGTAAATSVVGSMGPVDGVVVLSHDIAASCELLAAGLRGGCGYIGALGSRHTQGKRADHLRTLGLSDAELARVCGPVGLDLGSRTPEETALAIFAEALKVQRSKSADSLRASTGAING
jgi:xanthine dehydrogenase accessory factor